MADNEMRIKIRVDQSEYKSAMKSMGNMQKNVSNGFNNMSNSATNFGNASAKGFTKATGAGKGTGKMWLSLSTGLGTLTGAATPAGAAIMVAGKAAQAAGKLVKDSVMDYAKFEGTLKQVQVITGGTQEDFDLLADKAMELGAKTSIGAQDVANAQVEFAKLGFSAKETAEAMTGIVYAAEASGSEVSSTAQIVADSLNIWKMGAEESIHVADVLSQTANISAADMSDLGYTIQYAGAAASQAGYSIDDLATMTAIMANNGVRGSKAGTAIRTAMTNLISPTDNAAIAMEELGVHLQDAEGNARPIPRVMEDLRGAFHRLSKEEQLDLATTIFGKPGAAGMVAYLKETQENVDNMTDSMVNSTGTAEKQAKQMRETLEGQMDQLGDSFDTLKLKIGKAFEPMTKDLLKGANDSLDWLTEALDGITGQLEDVEKYSGVFSDFDVPDGTSKALEGTNTELGKFADLVQKADQNAKDFQTGGIFSFMGQGASEIQALGDAMDDLTAKGLSFNFLSEEDVQKASDSTYKVVKSIQDMGGLIAIENAKYQNDPSYSPSKAISASVTKDLPTLEAGLNGQLEAVKTSNDNMLGALRTFGSNSTTLTQEQQNAMLMAQSTSNQLKESDQKANNDRILELYRDLGNKSYTERQEALALIQGLEEKNNQATIDATQATADSILATLQAQASKTGEVTQAQKNAAIEAANTQRDKTVQAAQDQYVQSVSAINQMSDEAVSASGRTRDELISDAKTQLTQTVASAEEMRDGTVSSINDIENKANETDGKEINVNAKLNGKDSVLGGISEIMGAIGNGTRDLFVNVHKSVTETVNKIQGKARGGLTSGVAMGMGSGKATYSAGASAMGVGTQLGQGGVSQGVVSNEKGREVTMPVGNATYMRPFARAIADELRGETGGGGQQTIVVPLYVNGREFARATNEDMTREQTRMQRISNRAVGK